jgi:hypothetical protein
MKNEKTVHFVVEQLIKIMNDKKLTKSAFADLVGFKEAKWNKISNRRQSLSVNELSIIARKLQMREIDIYTYPKVFVESNSSDDHLKAQLTIELKEDLKQKVLELIFGNKNVQILT